MVSGGTWQPSAVGSKEYGDDYETDEDDDDAGDFRKGMAFVSGDRESADAMVGGGSGSDMAMGLQALISENTIDVHKYGASAYKN